MQGKATRVELRSSMSFNSMAILFRNFIDLIHLNVFCVKKISSDKSLFTLFIYVCCFSHKNHSKETVF